MSAPASSRAWAVAEVRRLEQRRTLDEFIQPILPQRPYMRIRVAGEGVCKIL